MSDVPINSTGFAHGFRPLEGDHPPPTPTQRDLILPSSNGHHNQFSADCNGLSFLSASSRVTAQNTVVGRNSSLAPSRKRRRFPGPLAFLQHGGLSNRSNSLGNDGRRPDRAGDPDISSDNGEKGEVGGGHFEKGPWLSVCSAVDAPIPEEGASDAEAVEVFLSVAPSPMSEVLAGEFDLQVPVIMAVIDIYTRQSQIDTTVQLVDPSGRMKGYLHPMCVEEYGPELGPGAALLLKEVSIFVTGPGTTRLLNIHPDCILAVFPADTPPPSLARLRWLRNCDPPFTPRLVDESGDGAPPNPDRRLSPPVTPASAAPRPRSPSRRRPRTPVSDNVERSSPPSQQQKQEKKESPAARNKRCNSSEADVRRLGAPGRDVSVSPPPMVEQESDDPSQHPARRRQSSHRSRTPTPAATSHPPATPVLMPLGRPGISTNGFPSGVDKEGIGDAEEQNVLVGKGKTSISHVARTTSREVPRAEGHRGTQRPQDRLSNMPDGNKGSDNRPAASMPRSIWENLGGVDSDESEGDGNASHGGTAAAGDHEEVASRRINVGKACSKGGDQSKSPVVTMDSSNGTDVTGGDATVASQAQGSTDPHSSKSQSKAAGAGWAFSFMRDGDGDAFLDAALEDDDSDLMY